MADAIKYPISITVIPVMLSYYITCFKIWAKINVYSTCVKAVIYDM